MPKRIGSKIVAVIKVVRRTQNLAATAAALGLATITTLFFLPNPVSARIAMLVPSLLYFSRKIYLYVYARNAVERLAFEERFVGFGTEAEHLADSLGSANNAWTHSAIVKSVRSADFRPEVDVLTESVLARKLERHLRRAFSEMMLPRPLADHILLVAWIASWIYIAILHPSPSVLAATVLFVSGIALFTGVLWIELNLGLSLREQRGRLHNLYWDLAVWLVEQFGTLRDRETGDAPYHRKEHFRDNPWFTEDKSAA